MSRLAAVARNPEQLDLFAVGFNNKVWSTFWNPQHGWNHHLFRIPGPQVFEHKTQQIAAVARNPEQLDLFVIGFDNKVWSTFWNPQHHWNGEWFRLPGSPANPSISLRAIAPAGEGRFVEVTGVGFTSAQGVKISYDIFNGGGPTTHQTGVDTIASNLEGGFVHRTRVNLGGDVSGAHVQAVDVTTGRSDSSSL